MRISFGICTHNEGTYIAQLVDPLIAFIRGQPKNVEYEIILVDDYSSDPTTLFIIKDILKHADDLVRVFHHQLNHDFAAHKNFMTAQCSGDWILNLDADETIGLDFLDLLPLILDSNPDVDAYWFPRMNTVDGLTLTHVQKWGWVLSKDESLIGVKALKPTDAEYQLLKAYDYIIGEDDGFVSYYRPLVCWPDVQMRLYRNVPSIRWEGKVHERLVGFTNFTTFPTQMPYARMYAIQHHKTLDRQEEQNSYYSTLQVQS